MLDKLYKMKYCFKIYAELKLLCPPSKKRRHIALHMSVGLSVCLSVTFSFLINSSRTPWRTFLKLCQHIRPQQQRNPIDLWVKGQGHRGIICQNRLSNNFENEFLLHTFVLLILNWLVQLYKTSVTKTGA